MTNQPDGLGHAWIPWPSLDMNVKLLLDDGTVRVLPRREFIGWPRPDVDRVVMALPADRPDLPWRVILDFVCHNWDLPQPASETASAPGASGSTLPST